MSRLRCCPDCGHTGGHHHSMCPGNDDRDDETPERDAADSVEPPEPEPLPDYDVVYDGEAGRLKIVYT